ncbi:MAG: metal-dependent transcriptional regulator [Deltaproteobacteria bacterium]|nr:metal-dependent transcriptional regulator [Candidatus Anaeroferrophillus wilburensis]MBN2889405.1 metal-dependent transcriptional regulator [Deltaproteobacteria bacterium]
MTLDLYPDLSPTQEDYLAAIYQIVKSQQIARANSIARKLGVGLSSVTAALKSLAAKKLINYRPYSYVTLTDDGTALGRQLTKKHQVLVDFLTRVLALPAADAEHNAHRLEHAVDEEVLNRIISFITFLEQCPRGGMEWIAQFSHFYESGSRVDHCAERFDSWFSKVCHHQQVPYFSKGESTMNITLADLNPRESGKILAIRGSGPSNKRFMEMGLIPGSMVSVEKIAPLGDPIDVKIKGYHLSLRREEAAGIKIERLRHGSSGEKK